MYKKMMVPVDLAHIDRLGKALDTAAELAKSHDTPICYVGVTTGLPGAVAHNPKEYGEKLEAFAKEQGGKHGVKATAKVFESHDPARDLGETLIKATKETGSDLVVMASHVPGVPEHIFSSNAGYVASHADVSVFVIR